ncbi:ubiquitin carboxyl-terminal hydrolase 16/45 [Bacillus rossius redtenbacheri]|uniref:ubiquitin carboxyl-terminal hydrolase 16/45 n=1 Tax=Bacillus rossius redtenbacheri TaxID=93214 RepID=UPI002FDDB8F2
MGKKKKNRQQEEANGEESTESGDETQSSIIGAVACPHVAKAVDLQKVKKSLKPSGNIPRECAECVRSKEPAEDENDEEWSPNLWLCLKCGNVACGRMRRRHALKHHSTPHSEPHDLALNTDDWRVWCYSCDDQIPAAHKRKLLECVEFVKRQSSVLLLPLNCNANVIEAAPAVQDELPPVVDSNRSVTFMAGDSSSKAKSTAAAPGNLPRVRGLSNLGNTCFFNAVLQCLAQTPYLLPILQEMHEPGQKFQLAGDPDQDLPPLGGELGRWGALTETLADALEELRSDRAEVFVPRKLLSKLTQRWPQFAGGDQHDSHELLRHMLEGVRSEDLKRYQLNILRQLGLSEKCDPTQVEGELRSKARAYGAQLSERLLHPEHVFRGYLVSIVQCQDCHHSSNRVESFLDLSLPVIADKSQPRAWRRKSSHRDEPLEGPAGGQQSKHQLKKERKQARKGRKGKGKSPGSPDQAAEENGGTSKSADSEQSDADVEDNVEQDARGGQPSRDVPESGYSSEKLANDSPLPNGDSALASPAADRLASDFSRLSLVPAPPPLPLALGWRNGAARDEEEEEDDEDDDLSQSSGSSRGAASDSSWSRTLAARYQCEEGDTSVQSCLSQFTAVELMTGNNKVGCESCSQRHNQDKAGKMVYTNATKQLLVSSPPAVLILHLKRFQVLHSMFRKISSHVHFPMVLDLAPICSVKCKESPTMNPEQSQVLYALYGIVEHSGTLHGGHYVAYVKVRPELAEDDPRWAFVPRDDGRPQRSAPRPRDEGAHGPATEPPPGRWYYVSDSRVSEVTEDKVLQSQAYLLFYERIW